MKHRVFLFDIDGTLINAQGSGRRALELAAQKLFGQMPALESRDFAGHTDAWLFKKVINTAQNRHEADAVTPEHLSDLTAHYLTALQNNLAEKPAARLAGADELIRHCANLGGTESGLLTGNIRAASELKLGDMYSFFKFGFYGDAAEDRDHIAQNARNYITETFSSETEIIVVGDTPKDIQCARAIGAHVVAVSTGMFAAHELSAADVVINSLDEAFRLGWFR